MDIEYYRDLVSSFLSGRKIVVIGKPLGSVDPYVKELIALGTERPLILAEGRGTGDLPSPDECSWHVLPTGDGDHMESLRFSERLLANLPADAVSALNEYDPNGAAVVLGSPFSELKTVEGRPIYGGRPPHWTALEDKIAIDDFWDKAGIARAPTAIVGARDRDAMLQAKQKLDEGLGVVLSGDSREGFNGGAIFVRWIRNESDWSEAIEFFGERCDRVRVMPFLEGVACSIHGIVFDDTEIAFRPVEMITLREAGSSKLKYAGCSTRWDPADADREVMRDVARKAARRLRDTVHYRGAFTVDGVMSERGFLPTEMNTRYGAGLNTMSRCIKELPLIHVDTMIRAGIAADYRPYELEKLVVEATDQQRLQMTWTSFDRSVTETSKHVAVRDGDSYRLADDDQDHDVVFTVGESPSGGFIRCVLTDPMTELGKPFSPEAAQLYAFTDREFNTGFGDLTPALSVR